TLTNKGNALAESIVAIFWRPKPEDAEIGGEAMVPKPAEGEIGGVLGKKAEVFGKNTAIYFIYRFILEKVASA
ncbi:MAG: hypothetical protein COX62_02790, partial [Deltaproteobacteria bacterium CG_4_10_14_0_2_um_filter_43_8]